MKSAHKISAFTDAQLIAAYEAHKSVWRAADSLGVRGQSLHRRIAKYGVITPINVLTDAEAAVMRAEYEVHANAGTLNILADRLQRGKTTLCFLAKRLGLTDRNRKRPYASETSRAAITAWHKNNPHPKGFAGHRHTASAREVIARKSKVFWAGLSSDERSDLTLKMMKAQVKKNGTLVANPRPHATWRAGHRTIGGQQRYFRSRWEANYARYLEWLRERGEIRAWRHEPQTFWFEKIKRGVRSYLPDFEVTENNDAIVFHEVKGWMDDRSKTKIARMAKYYPTVKLIVIDGKGYAAIASKVGKLVPGWEAESVPPSKRKCS